MEGHDGPLPKLHALYIIPGVIEHAQCTSTNPNGAALLLGNRSARKWPCMFWISEAEALPVKEFPRASTELAEKLPNPIVYPSRSISIEGEGLTAPKRRRAVVTKGHPEIDPLLLILSRMEGQLDRLRIAFSTSLELH